MDEKIESILRLERLAFEEIQFTRDTSSASGTIEYEMNFNRSVGIADDGNHFAVKLIANLWSKTPNALRIKVSLIGYFYCECEDTTLKDTLIKYNTLSILFPYIRSQISLITAQPDLSPIVLPPVNIVAMFEAVDNNDPNSDSRS